MNAWRRYALVVLATCLGSRTPAAAQQTVAEGRSPDDDVAAAKALLARPVTVHFDRLPLARAVEMVSASAKIRLVYQRELTDASSKLVTVHVSKTPLGTVLETVLDGTGLAVVAVRGGQLALVERGRDGARMFTGAIVGTVTDGKTKLPLRGASVTLDDSARRVLTDAHGGFRFTSVTAGVHRVAVRFVGYARERRSVTVVDEQTTTLDVTLSSSVNTLDQVVVTATGTQQYRELGHIVTQINADSVVREAPVTSLSELLTGRVPGLQVITPDGGYAGGDVSLRIRGTSTTSLDPQPIVIVDGVRYRNDNFINGTEDSRPFFAQPRSPLNDLNVNDIETIEVVKGPSASTLYGPDAANGVIVVTTKRGRASTPEWHIYAYPNLSTLSVGGDGRLGVQQLYQGWGHVPGTSTVYPGQCDIRAQASGACAFDSLTTLPTPADDPRMSVVTKQRPQWHSGASVAGGTGSMTYFFSGNYDAQTGMLRLSPEAAAVLKSQLGESALSDAVRDPNSQQMLNLHTNVSSQLTSWGTIALVANYTHATQRAIDAVLFGSQYVGSAPAPGADSAAVAEFRNNSSEATNFLSTTQARIARLTATVNGTVQPRAWLTANASVGVDLDNSIDIGVRSAGSLYARDGGEADDFRRATTNRNAHIGATATGHSAHVSFRTSVGTDYSYNNFDGLSTIGFDLAPGSHDISTTSSQSISRSWSEIAQLGAYGEEVVGVHDRLFLTGSLRLDGSTSFGDDYHPHPFPKLGASWIVSDEPALAPVHRVGLDELRLRYSFGAASRYPTSAMKLGTITPLNTSLEGRTQSLFLRNSLANPLLRPERSRESEYGMDATLVSIVQLGLTWYHRRTDDELQLLGAPNGFLGGWANVGDLTADGFETTVTAKVFESNRATLNLTFTYAKNTNTVLSLGAASPNRSIGPSVMVGYPISSSFGTRTIGYVDSAGGGPDGYIAARSEVISSPVEYLGQLIAPQTYTFTPSLALFGGQLRISSLFDRQTGGVQYDGFSRNCAYGYTCPAAFLKSTPLLEQARNLPYNNGDFVVSSDFTRWREINVTGDLPLSLRRRLHLSRASVSVQGRNLALWTPFTGPDPESVYGLGATATGGGAQGILGTPQPRIWTFRFDLSP